MNGFPYFQFHVDRWTTGKINAFDLDEQGLFVHFCLLSWSNLGAFNICSTTVQRRYRKSAEWIDATVEAFVEVGIIERDGDKYRIKFIDEQVELLTGKRQQRVDAGKASAAARKAALLNSIDNKDNKESKEEKRREEKSSALNTRSTTVQQSLGSCGVAFDRFWAVYPNKKGKKDAKKAFAKAKDLPPIDDLIAEVELQSKSEEWKKENGQFIPHPATWLNRGGWDDEVTIKE